MAQTTTPVQTSNCFGALLDGHDLQQRQFVVSQLNEFTYQLELRQRLQACLCSLAQQIPLHNIGCVQVWRSASQQQQGVDPLMLRLYADPELVILGDPCFTSFRISSCQSLQWGKEGMPGRVLKSGCVQVVQNLRIIPDVLHPRCRIADAITDQVGEVVYVPVYCTSRPHAGPVAVVEAVLSAHATDSMLVANFISIAGTALSAMQLSLSNPLPQPVRRSKLEGRKPRPIHSSSSQDLQQYVPAAEPAPAAACEATKQHPAAAEGALANPVPLQLSCTVTAPGECAATTAADASKQPNSSCSTAPVSPAALEASKDQQLRHSSSCSAASTGLALGSILPAGADASVGTAGTSAADSMLDSTLSSKLRSAASMPPPQASSSKCRRRYDCQDMDDAVVPEGVGQTVRPCKMRRMLSICRTKSVPVGLDQVLQAAVAAGVAADSC